MPILTALMSRTLLSYGALKSEKCAAVASRVFFSEASPGKG